MSKCGFVAVIGAPNAGKSTLINALVGTKVTIVSPKVQTTRTRVLGIAINHETQIILVDTPGIFMGPKKRLERAMVKRAWDNLSDADGIMFIVDASLKHFEEIDEIIATLKSQGKTPILVLNKIDLVQKDSLLKLAERFSKLGFEQIFMISALKGNGVEDIKSYWEKTLPESPWLFPEDQLSDLPQKLWAAEITREEIFHRLHQELPYEIWVETDSWEALKNGSLKINQTIYVSRESQRSIVLGKGGQQIKAIGAAARQQISQNLDLPVHLFLHVKVKADWMNTPRFYKTHDLDFGA